MQQIPPDAFWIIDFFGHVQVLKEPLGHGQVLNKKRKPKTFGDVALSILHYICNIVPNASGIDIVTDRYYDTSTKNPERQRRDETGPMPERRITINSSEQKALYDWKNYLSNRQNK